MLSRTHTVGLLGVDGFVITVEAEVGLGLPCLTVVGQCSGALAEARERVRTALRYSGHDVPPRRQVVNLAPAERRKDSPGVDLAVACALLQSHGIIPEGALDETLLWGELGLDGRLRAAQGTLAVAHVAREAGFKRIAVAEASVEEASLIPGLQVFAVRELSQWVAQLRGDLRMEARCGDGRLAIQRSRADVVSLEDDELDMADVRGLERPRLALELMVAGGHNLLFHGSPGVGKTMLARRAQGLFPPLDREAALEVSKIHSVARLRNGGEAALIERAPLRMPHHSVSAAGLLGGGTPPRPGEASLAHRGLLFLDELPEYSRTCIEGLREPIEAGVIHLVRAKYALKFPARFQLLAAMNPCPCGYFGHSTRACVCSPQAVARYQRKISGPFIDRIDLVVPVVAQARAVAGRGSGCSPESSASIRRRILVLRAMQNQRFRDLPWSQNAGIPARGSAMDRFCCLDPDAERLLEAVAEARDLSARALHRVRRVALSVSDRQRVIAQWASGLGEWAEAYEGALIEGACSGVEPFPERLQELGLSDVFTAPIDRSAVALALQLRQLPTVEPGGSSGGSA